MFESFAFKRGIPVDADYVFDVRMLPNPHYEPELRDLTGQDLPVIQWLRQHEEVERMYQHIAEFLSQWLGPLAQNQRSYVTVAVGCTGGQHRSVYFAERLARHLRERFPDINVAVHHREEAGWPARKALAEAGG